MNQVIEPKEYFRLFDADALQSEYLEATADFSEVKFEIRFSYDRRQKTLGGQYRATILNGRSIASLSATLFLGKELMTGNYADFRPGLVGSQIEGELYRGEMARYEGKSVRLHIYVSVKEGSGYHNYSTYREFKL